MGFLDKFKKKEKVLQQDTSQRDNHPGMAFMIHLLMDEMCEMPDKERMNEVMNRHLGETECFSYDENGAGFAAKKYTANFENGKKQAPPMLMIMGCVEIKKPIMDEVAESQLWDCPDGDEIMKSCKYQVIATDMLGAGLDYKDRAEMLVDYIEALVELFPTCRAVVFETSKKMFTREAIINCSVPKKSRFIYYAVNVRFFNIQGTDDSIVDSVGMSTLFLPDVQYHFHGVDPDAVVNHAYNVLTYIFDFDEENPLKAGDTVDGIADGQMSRDVQWKVQYEESLIQPIREVVDVNMGEFASGSRQ